MTVSAGDDENRAYGISHDNIHHYQQHFSLTINHSYLAFSDGEWARLSIVRFRALRLMVTPARTIRIN